MTTNEDVETLKKQCEAKLMETNKTLCNPLEQAIRALDEVLERDGELLKDRGTGARLKPARVIEILTEQTARTQSILS